MTTYYLKGWNQNVFFLNFSLVPFQTVYVVYILFTKIVIIIECIFFLQSTKILKNGFNVNAQEWKPSRRTSVGNTSVKDIPMLDMFLQRLGDRHSYSDPCSVPNGESAVNGPVTGVSGSPGPDPSAGVPTTLKAGGPPGNSEKESTRA